MTEIDAIKQEVLEECDEDHVGLWNVIRDVKEIVPAIDPERVKDTTLTVLSELLRDKKIVAGYPTKEGTFTVWEVSPDLVLEYVDREWKSLGRDPTIGEVVWFTTINKQAA